MIFDQWMDELNAECQGSFGLSIHDLPDMCFRDAFDVGQAPLEFLSEHLPDLDSLQDLILS